MSDERTIVCPHGDNMAECGSCAYEQRITDEIHDMAESPERAELRGVPLSERLHWVIRGDNDLTPKEREAVRDAADRLAALEQQVADLTEQVRRGDQLYERAIAEGIASHDRAERLEAALLEIAEYHCVAEGAAAGSPCGHCSRCIARRALAGGDDTEGGEE